MRLRLTRRRGGSRAPKSSSDKSASLEPCFLTSRRRGGFPVRLQAESSSLAEPTLVPTGFVVPFEFVTEQFRLEPLGPTHNDADYEAWSSSADHIHATPGSAARTEVLVNLRDLDVGRKPREGASVA
jgi:hypothetical protein